MTLANDGVRYKTHLVKSIRSYDGVETVVEPEIAAKVKLSKEAIDAVREGMVKASSSTGTARQFVNANIRLPPRPERPSWFNPARITVFLSPMLRWEKPEVAIAVLLEHGSPRPKRSISPKKSSIFILSKSEGQAPTPEGVLLQNIRFRFRRPRQSPGFFVWFWILILYKDILISRPV